MMDRHRAELNAGLSPGPPHIGPGLPPRILVAPSDRTFHGSGEDDVPATMRFAFTGVHDPHSIDAFERGGQHLGRRPNWMGRPSWL